MTTPTTPTYRENGIQPRTAFARALRADPRWVGPYFAIATMFLALTDREGEGGSSYQLKRIARSVNMPDLVVRRAQQALIEQGYIVETNHGYRLVAFRPALEIALAEQGDAPESFKKSGPASEFIAREVEAWKEFQQSRHAIYAADREAESA